MNNRVGIVILSIIVLSLVFSGCDATITGDAKAVCGNGVCDPGENSAKCPEDCGTSTCGNGVCESSEDSENCPEDCGINPCGDGVCEGSAAGEDCNSCAADCPKEFGPPTGSCDACFKGICDGKCNPTKEGSDCSDCAPRDVIACCGDGVCEGGETVFSCVVDCGCIPTTEICDGVDNDCDSFIDEDLTMQCGVTDVGACEYGISICTEGSWGLCQGNIDPTDEICDGSVDDDCDGVIDDGCDCSNGQTKPCGSDVGECETGTQTCNSGSWGACIGEAGPTTEICDGLDNNCNNETDEGLNIECSSALNCGTNRWVGLTYCGADNNVHRAWTNYICTNAGTCSSSCSNQTTDYIYQWCSNGCFNGYCISGGNETNST
ncbi:MAG: hypothetical protein KAK00_06780 [Nanoarchaeota archaeon]|nr:hypothetical protein [Nanoarchaeota archaeon]